VTAAQMISELQRRGVHLSARGGRVCVDAPAGVITPNMRNVLAAQKAELLQLLAGDRQHADAFRLVNGPMDFGDICAGWTPSGWAEELRRKADRCDNYRPDVATYYRNWAIDIEWRIRAPKGRDEEG
jgi:hypothetical protein